MRRIESQATDMTPGNISQNNVASNNKQRQDKESVCQYCGSMHARAKGPAYGVTCIRSHVQICGKINHFARVCGGAQNRPVTLVRVRVRLGLG